jgi:hypothetical protein
MILYGFDINNLSSDINRNLKMNKSIYFLEYGEAPTSYEHHNFAHYI